MFCTKCGNALPDDARFCTVCGAAMAAPAVAPAEAPATAEPAAEPVAAPEATEAVAEAPEVTEAPAEAVTPETLTNDAEESAPEENANYAAPSCVPYTEEAPVAPTPKKGKKKLILLIVAAVLGLALIVGGVLFVLAYTSPAAKVARAFSKTSDAFKQVTEDAETFRTAIDNLSNLEDGMTFKLDLNVNTSMEGYFSSDSHYFLQMDRNMNDRELFSRIQLSSSFTTPEAMLWANSESEVEITAYANDKYMMASMPGIVDGYYSLPQEQLGEKLLDSALGELIADKIDDEAVEQLKELDIDLFPEEEEIKSIKEICPKEYAALIDSIQIEAVDSEIPYGETSEEVYLITWDMDALINFLMAYEDAYYAQYPVEAIQEAMDDVYDFLEKLDMEVYLGVVDGYLVAMHLDIDYEGENHTATVRLEGNGNIWEEFSIFADGEEGLTGSFSSTGSGFELSLVAEGEELLLECDDALDELTLSLDGEELCTISYDAENSGCSVTYEYVQSETDFSGKIRVKVEFLPVEEIEAPAEVTDLLTLNEDELYDLADEISDALSGANIV